jgi:hypothetical protein
MVVEEDSSRRMQQRRLASAPHVLVKPTSYPIVHLQTCLRAALAGLLLASSYADESITRLLRMNPFHGRLPVRPERAPTPSPGGFPPPSLVAARAEAADMGSDRGMSRLPRDLGLLPVVLRSPVARGVGVVVVVVANNPALMRW